MGGSGRNSLSTDLWSRSPTRTVLWVCDQECVDPAICPRNPIRHPLLPLLGIMAWCRVPVR